MNKKPKLTVKEQKLIKAVVQGKTKMQAGLEAGYGNTPEAARVSAHQALQKPTVQQAIQDAMVKLNITPERALAPVDEALNHRSLDYRLKGSDRAVKALSMLVPKGESNTNINFINVQKQDKDEFGL